MDSLRRTLLERWARAAALTGDYANAKEVADFLRSRGHDDIDALFADPVMTEHIDGLCAHANKGSAS